MINSHKDLSYNEEQMKEALMLAFESIIIKPYETVILSQEDLCVVAGGAGPCLMIRSERDLEILRSQLARLNLIQV